MCINCKLVGFMSMISRKDRKSIDEISHRIDTQGSILLFPKRKDVNRLTVLSFLELIDINESYEAITSKKSRLYQHMLKLRDNDINYDEFLDILDVDEESDRQFEELFKNMVDHAMDDDNEIPESLTGYVLPSILMLTYTNSYIGLFNSLLISNGLESKQKFKEAFNQLKELVDEYLESDVDYSKVSSKAIRSLIEKTAADDYIEENKQEINNSIDTCFNDFNFNDN